MNAFELIASIYARPQAGVASNVRFITARQLFYLKDLIGADPDEGGALESAGPGVWLWMPKGRMKYEITEDLIGNRHKIARLANMGTSGTGRLF